MNPLINNKEIRRRILQDPVLVFSDLEERLEISTSSYAEEDLREADKERLDEIRETLCQLGYQPEKPESAANLFGLLRWCLTLFYPYWGPEPNFQTDDFWCGRVPDYV